VDRLQAGIHAERDLAGSPQVASRR